MRNLAITCLFCSSEPSTTNSTTDATPVLCHRQQELPYTGSGETMAAIRFTLDMSSTACACHSSHMCRHWQYEEPIVAGRCITAHFARLCGRPASRAPSTSLCIGVTLVGRRKGGCLAGRVPHSTGGSSSLHYKVQ